MSEDSADQESHTVITHQYGKQQTANPKDEEKKKSFYCCGGNAPKLPIGRNPFRDLPKVKRRRNSKPETKSNKKDRIIMR